MSKWSKLYEKEIIESSSVEDYINNKLKTKTKVVKLINKYAINHEVLELGSGTGILSLHVSSLGNHVTALDKDNDMIKLSKKYFLNEFKDANIKYVCKDIKDFKPKTKYDVCYSIGILEHYTDKEIIKLIQKQLDICSYIIFGIPTKYFDEDKKMYGDERYLTIKYWRYLIKLSGCKIIEESSYHYLNILGKILNVKKWFKPNPVHVFVIKK